MIFSTGYIGMLMMWFSMLSSRASGIRFTPIDVLSVMIFALYISGSPHSGMAAFSIYGLCPVYIAFRSGKIGYNSIFFALSTATLVLATTGYLQWAGILAPTDLRYTITGPYPNSSVYGGMLGLLLAIMIPAICPANNLQANRRIKTVAVFTLAFALPALVASNARAAWLAVGAAVIYSLYAGYRKKIAELAGRTKVLIIFFLTVSLIPVAVSLYRMKPDSAEGRVLIWKVSLQMIRNKPLTGFGREGFEARYMHYQAKYLKENGTEKEKLLAGNNHLVFNEPIRVMVEYGIMGFALYVAFMYCLLFRRKPSGGILHAFASFPTAFFVWGLLSYPDKIHPVMLLLTIVTATFSSKEKETVICIPVHSIFRSLLKMVFVGTGLLFFLLLGTSHNHYRNFYQILSERNQVNRKELLQQFETLAPAMHAEAGFVALYTRLLYKERQDSVFILWLSEWEKRHPVNELYILAGDFLKKRGEYPQAEANYWLAHFMVPSMQRARSRLAFLYREMGDEEKARDMTREILTEKVKVYGFETYRLHRELEEAFELESQ